jgi:hypothetical protein
MTCHDARPLLGVYVLGKADPVDQALVEAHVDDCPACRDELKELAGIRGLLALVPASAVAGSDGQPGMPRASVRVGTSPSQLPRLLAAAAEVRARRRRRSLVAVAVLLLVLGSGFLATARYFTTPRPPTAEATWVATDTTSGTRAALQLEPQPAGTAIGLTLSGVRAGTRCSLVVTARDGSTTSAASWQADHSGTATVTGFTATQLDQIRDVAIVTSTGRTLARITPAPAGETATDRP